MREVWPLVGGSSMRALDRHTIDSLGVPGDLLMESAGRCVVDAVLAELTRWPAAANPEVVVVCGTGNNGGDGLVAARHLQLRGVPVRVALLGAANSVKGDASRNLKRASKLGVSIQGERWRPPTCGVIVDAIFGTGLSRSVGGPARASIRRINRGREGRGGAVRVVSVDLPSGLSADTGQVLGEAVRADVTVTIELPKLGLVFEPGRSCAGRIRVAQVGIAHVAPGTASPVELWTAAGAGARLPPRPRDGHKGSFGHALIVAGSQGKTGAAALAAQAAGRAGAGLVSVACPAGLNDILEIKCTEAMTLPVADTPTRALAASAEEAVLALAAECDAVGLGPGLGREEETQHLVMGLAKRLECPLAIDADGLLPFAAKPALLGARRAPTLLTPHPGEAARLLGTNAREVNADRMAAARELARATGCAVLLKGAGSVTVSPDGRAVVNPTGGPALASGGTGDVLLGIVAALLAQRIPAFEAGALGAFLHGWTADRLSERTGSSGLLAEDLLAALPEAAQRLRECSAGGDPGADAHRASEGAREAHDADPFPGS